MSKIRSVVNAVVAAALVSGAGVTPVLAGDAIADLRTCAAEKDDGARLRCYDTEMRRLSVASPAPASSSAAAIPTAPVTAAAAVASPLSGEDSFGFSRLEVHERREAAPKGPDSIESPVTDIVKRPYGELVLTLANGQVWAQKAGEPATRLKLGDAVVIKRASLGSFMMSTPEGRAIRVARIK